MECEICKNECTELFDYRVDGYDDIYIFDICEQCLDYYSSDLYMAEDIQHIIDNSNFIKIDISDDLKVLTYEDHGRIMYEMKVKDKIDWDKFNIIRFPKHIKEASLSFFIGFQEGIFSEIRRDEFTKYFRVEGNEKLVNKFMKTIYI